MWYEKLIAGLFGETAGAYIEYRATKRRLKQEVQLEEIRGKIAYQQAKSQRASDSEGRDHEWEVESIRNSGWKDEWVLLLLSIPLVLVFIPATQPYVAVGFDHLENTPEWYRWLTTMIFSAIYGIRIWRRKIFTQA